MPLEKYEDFLDMIIKDSSNSSSVCGLNTSGRKVELAARAFPVFKLKTNIVAFLWGAPVTFKGSSNQWSKVIFKQQKFALHMSVVFWNHSENNQLLSVISQLQSPTCTICCECHEKEQIPRRGIFLEISYPQPSPPPPVFS